MPQPNARRHTLVGLIGLLLLATLFASLGNWQLNRAAEREAIAQEIAHGREQPAITLQAGTATHTLTPWRPATATGTWRHDLTVLLENRRLDGRLGYWVATPLLLQGTNQDTAVLVLRGWLPRPTHPGQPEPAIPAPDGTFTVRGDLLAHVPRLFELWSFAGGSEAALPERLPTNAETVPKVQNLALDAYARATGLKLVPVVLAQTAPAQPPGTLPDPLQRQWPEPSLDADKNRGYALQWFSFCAIAVIAALVLVWRHYLRRARPRETS